MSKASFLYLNAGSQARVTWRQFLGPRCFWNFGI